MKKMTGLWKNVPGSKDAPRCACGCWIHHWYRFSSLDINPKCFVKGCKEEAVDGAHVYPVIPPGTLLSPALYIKGVTKEFIVPMCREHNNPNNTETMIFKPGAMGVPAGVFAECQGPDDKNMIHKYRPQN